MASLAYGRLNRDFKNCLNFNGSTSFVLKSTQTAYNLTNFSISLWVKGPTRQVDKRVYGEGNSAAANPFFSLGTQTTGTDGTLKVQIRDDAGATVLTPTFSTTPVFDQKWHHIVWSDASGTVTLYIDGIADATSFNYTRGTLTLDRTAIGALVRNTTGFFFLGQIDQVVVYNVALTSTEAKNLYGGMRRGTRVIEYNFDSVCSASAVDTSANQSVATITAATYSPSVFRKPRRSAAEVARRMFA